MTLLRLSQYLYAVEKNNEVYQGTRQEAMRLLKSCGILSEEIFLAMEYFERDNHNRAEFGVNKTFIFSIYDPEVLLRIPCRGAA